MRALREGRARAGDRAAAVVHGHHRRQRRQHPVQRAPLADRPARREADPAGLRRPEQVRGRRRPDGVRRPLLAPRRPAGRPAGGPADQPVRLPARPGAAGRLPAAVRHQGARHAVVLGLRQPRRAGPGQRPLEPAGRPDRDRVDEDHRPAARREHRRAGRAAGHERPGGAPDAVRRTVAPGDGRPQPATAHAAPRPSRSTSSTTGAPHGHGYTNWNLATCNAYYTFGKGKVRVHRTRHRQPVRRRRGLDRRDPAGLARPSSCKTGSRHYLDESGHVVRAGSTTGCS